MLEYYNLQNGKLNYKYFLNKYNFDYLLLNNDDTLYYNIDKSEYELVYEYNKINIYHHKLVYYKIYKRIEK